jgi:putative Holliday junction resolvase
VAVSDRTGTIATALRVVPRSGSTASDHAAIAGLIADEEAEVVVIGLPLNMNGTSGPAARAARAEASRLATVVSVPVVLFDERRTTVTADQALLAAGLKAPDRRRVVDKVAAAVMLQHWLDAGQPR